MYGKIIINSENAPIAWIYDIIYWNFAGLLSLTCAVYSSGNNFMVVHHLRVRLRLTLPCDPCTFAKGLSSKVMTSQKWFFSEIMGFIQLCRTTYGIWKKVHMHKKWLFSSSNSWDMGLWISNCFILNSLIESVVPEVNRNRC